MQSLSGLSEGYQMALPEHVFAALQKLFGVGHECFASPLNCTFPSFCSAFSDTDQHFGSSGSFFDFWPTEGSFEANPPFVEETMTMMVRHIIDICNRSERPLSFIVVVPNWDDDKCESYQLAMASAFCRGKLVLPKRRHQYTHRPRGH